MKLFWVFVFLFAGLPMGRLWAQASAELKVELDPAGGLHIFGQLEAGTACTDPIGCIRAYWNHNPTAQQFWEGRYNRKASARSFWGKLSTNLEGKVADSLRKGTLVFRVALTYDPKLNLLHYHLSDFFLLLEEAAGREYLFRPMPYKKMSLPFRRFVREAYLQTAQHTEEMLLGALGSGVQPLEIPPKQKRSKRKTTKLLPRNYYAPNGPGVILASPTDSTPKYLPPPERGSQLPPPQPTAPVKPGTVPVLPLPGQPTPQPVPTAPTPPANLNPESPTPSTTPPTQTPVEPAPATQPATQQPASQPATQQPKPSPTAQPATQQAKPVAPQQPPTRESQSVLPAKPTTPAGTQPAPSETPTRPPRQTESPPRYYLPPRPEPAPVIRPSKPGRPSR